MVEGEPSTSIHLVCKHACLQLLRASLGCMPERMHACLRTRRTHMHAHVWHGMSFHGMVCVHATAYVQWRSEHACLKPCMTPTEELAKYLLLQRGVSGLSDSLASQDDGEHFVTEMMSWEQRIWTENVLFGPWGPLS